MSANMDPFERQELVDKPGIIGAKWWHATLVDEAAKVARRDAIRSILIAGGVLAGFGALLGMCVKAASSDSGPETKDDRKTTLDIQKDYGWNFGWIGEPLVFDGVTSQPWDPSSTLNLASDMRPRRSDLRPFFQRTLFDAPDASPTKLADASPEDAAAFKKLATELKPISTSEMMEAYRRGASIASLFLAQPDAKALSGTKVALVVDLPGPEAVAFAAGAVDAFDPVFLFDNWPHPRGVVKAHLTLASALYYQPVFSKAMATGTSKRLPMFVLDRNRLASYTDDASQFDNRWVAKLPWPAASMAALGVSRVLYVVPRQSDAIQELDDLNDDFIGYKAGGIDVKIVPLDAFKPATELPDAGPPSSSSSTSSASAADQAVERSGYVYYGARPTTHYAFYEDYGLGTSPRPYNTKIVRVPPSGTAYAPAARKTPYSSGGSGAPVTSRPRPTSFATVPVVVAVGTGAILGARYARSGSWNRSSGGWGG